MKIVGERLVEGIDCFLDAAVVIKLDKAKATEDADGDMDPSNGTDVLVHKLRNVLHGLIMRQSFLIPEQLERHMNT